MRAKGVSFISVIQLEGLESGENQKQSTIPKKSETTKFKVWTQVISRHFTPTLQICPGSAVEL
jgi:hypothetical protein